MSNEQHQRLCTILANLVDVLACDELADLANACGIHVNEFYASASSRVDFETVIDMIAEAA